MGLEFNNFIFCSIHCPSTSIKSNKHIIYAPFDFVNIFYRLIKSKQSSDVEIYSVE